MSQEENLRSELEKFLQNLNIQTSCVEHPPVFTVEEMMVHLQQVSGVVTKNLFLKDKKKKNLWLVSACHDHQVGQGCATVLALLFDRDHSVKLVLDRDLVEGGHELVYFHPMTNAASMGIRPKDLLVFLKETGHEPVLESFR
ncbi:prolyl-tRNA synthetase associated domain-containing protein 1 isoform 2-T2 [Pholidichthys leucotaenia]